MSRIGASVAEGTRSEIRKKLESEPDTDLGSEGDADSGAGAEKIAEAARGHC